MTDNMRELIEEADRRYGERMIEDAARLYEEAASRKPDFRYAVNRLAYCYALRGQVKKLIKTCLAWEKALISSNQTELAGEVAKSILCFDPGSVDGRICMLNYVRDTQGEDKYFLELNDIVNYFLEIDEVELAIKVLENARETYPKNLDISVKLADMLMAEGEIGKATQAYRDIVDLLEGKGDDMRLADVYRRLEVLVPNDMQVIMRLADIYSQHNKYEEAIVEYRNALRVDYSNYIALRGLGNSMLGIKDYQGAVLAFRKVLVIEPNDIESRELLAKAYVAQGNIEDAVKDLLSVGSNLMSFEDYKEAQRIYETVLEICPDHTVAVRELSNIKDALARQKAREEQIRKLQTGGIKALQAEMVAKKEEEKKKAAEAVANAKAEKSVSSNDEIYGAGDDPYAGGTDLYGSDELYGGPGISGVADELGAPIDGEDVQLGAISGEDKEEQIDASKVSDNVAEGIERVLVNLDVEGRIYSPVPFVVAKYADMIPLIQSLIEEVPSQELFGWKALAKLELPNKEENADSQKDTASMPPTVDSLPAPSDGGAVRSAFGDSSGNVFAGTFSDNISSGGSRRRNDFFPGNMGGFRGGRYRRGSYSSENDNQMSLVEKIQQKQKQKKKK